MNYSFMKLPSVLLLTVLAVDCYAMYCEEQKQNQRENKSSQFCVTNVSCEFSSGEIIVRWLNPVEVYTIKSYNVYIREYSSKTNLTPHSSFNRSSRSLQIQFDVRPFTKYEVRVGTPSSESKLYIHYTECVSGEIPGPRPGIDVLVVICIVLVTLIVTVIGFIIWLHLRRRTKTARKEEQLVEPSTDTRANNYDYVVSSPQEVTSTQQVSSGGNNDYSYCQALPIQKVSDEKEGITVITTGIRESSGDRYDHITSLASSDTYHHTTLNRLSDSAKNNSEYDHLSVTR